ncbi:autotransporter outer membrane beta-barrel domain-containing protein [Brevundimonas naejangsanensis]|uniref:Autotransporter outer membrane beta-barrel domain-containing protein n=1 Tax=Brevundimonas naejangsanensis TaxID=588932 RepID=A0A494RMH7_9CAUL|nr:autotransporter outer membrane beta-barrel domain-containing protein [Brevundimonas naejangsanensis]AYG96123.1 autotransporter outer membrane beta-barrel domain-containing protein [Brevundimonas naejangsanensis]
MRILLASAVAIAPLLVASGVQAEQVVSTARTTPISTSTANNGAPDAVRLANGGSIAVTSGAAVTLDSSHDVKLDGNSKIDMLKAADGATGVLVNGGNTGNVTIAGSINITDSIEEYKDDDKDGDLDGPFADGTNRHGVHVTGASPLVGDIRIESSGSIKVEGNNSSGLTINAPLTGDIFSLGQINVVGNNTYGVHTTGDVTGDITLLGSITAMGENAVAVAVDGAVDGAVKIQGAVAVTGYRYTTPPPSKPTTGNPIEGRTYLENLDADDLLQGGPAVRIAGDVSKGVLFDTAPNYGPKGIDGDDDGDGVKNGDEDDDGDGKKNREDDDRDGDGITDVQETTAAIRAFGGAPAVLVGSADKAITLGAVGTGNDAYGLINRGSIEAAGVYKDIDTTAVQIGGTGQSVTLTGGLRNEGTINSTANTANSTAILVGAGATAPNIVNTGSIQSVSAGTNADLAAGILIDSGANVSSLTNSGTLAALVNGSKGDAVAIRDASGTLTSVSNTGNIIALITPEQGVASTGSAIAVDLSANSSGVTLVQDGVVVPDNKLPDADGDGVPDAKEPAILGDIRLGSGADVLDIRNGTVTGDISFGTGADRLSISGGALVTGKLSNGDGQLDIDISKGTLDARHTGQLEISELNVGADGNLIVTLDPANGAAGGFKVSGSADLADGAGLGVRFNSLIQDPTSFTIIEAGDLNVGAIDQDLLQSNSPYAFVVSSNVDEAAGKLTVDARRRTAEEAGMIKAEAAAYDVLYAGLADNEIIRAAMLNQTDRDGFFNIYQQLLPDHSGGPLLSLASGVDAVTRALTGRNASAAPGETSAWVQEINFYADKDKTDTYGFRSEGFGLAGGVERGTNMGAVGLTAAFTSSDLEDPEAAAEEVLSANLLELGLYWRAQGQYWSTWARAAGGYASFSATRKLVAEGVNLKNESDWHGFTLAAAGGASYERNFGRLNVRPEAYVEYFSLNEDARSERGGGDGFDLDIDKRDGHIFSGVAAVNVGYGFGKDGWIRPEVRLGWRQNFSVDAGTTIARLASGGDAFTLTPASIEGGGPLLGFRLNVGNDLGLLSITGDAEMLEDYVRYTLLLRASFKF